MASYIIFSEICYFAYGSNLTEPIVTEMLPTASVISMLIKILFCINLIFTIAIAINPANTTIESYALSRFKSNKTLHKWSINISRVIVITVACYIAVELSDKIDKFLGLLGALCCAPLAILMPALLNLKVLSKTPKEKL